MTTLIPAVTKKVPTKHSNIAVFIYGADFHSIPTPSRVASANRVIASKTDRRFSVGILDRMSLNFFLRACAKVAAVFLPSGVIRISFTLPS